MKISTKHLATFLCALLYMVIGTDAQAGVSDKCLNSILSVKNGVDTNQINKCIDLSNSIKKESICISECEGFTIPESFDYACTSNQDKQMIKNIITGIKQINSQRKKYCNTNPVDTTNTIQPTNNGDGQYYPQPPQPTNYGDGQYYSQPPNYGDGQYYPQPLTIVPASKLSSSTGNANINFNISMFLAVVVVALNLILY